MRYLRSVSARAGHGYCTTTLAVMFVFIHFSSGLAQTLPPERSGNPNQVLVSKQMRVPRWLAETVVRAAQATNTDPASMLALADQGASLLPNRKAQTSSAQGVFRFIESTWLEVLRRFGPKHGYAAEAAAIYIVQGQPVVSDNKQREAILNLRRDPYLSALMTGEMINTHRQILAGKVARDPSFAELYMAHFLGVQGANRFVELLRDRPGTSAQGVRAAAKADRSLFVASRKVSGVNPQSSDRR